MSRLFFDLQFGISGDMAVAALLGLGRAGSYAPRGSGVYSGADADRGSPRKPGTCGPDGPGKRAATPLMSVEELRGRLETLGLSGYRIEHGVERRSGLLGNTFTVTAGTREPRTFRDIRSLIASSGLDNREKGLALSIFEELARAESLVHGVSIGDVHFHEIGAVDSIVDIVGFAVLFARGGYEHARTTPIRLGGGRAESMYGPIPVPAPATLEIVRGLPVEGTGHPFELTTPTGAAIVKTVAREFGPLPLSVVLGVGTGFGKRKAPGINALRVYEYEEWGADETPVEEAVAVIETTIDDSTPEEIGFLTEELFGVGALDVYVTPAYMKKNRPGFTVTVLCPPGELDPCARTVLARSSSFGLRYHFVRRKTLERSMVKVSTKYGPLSVKVGSLGGAPVKVSPEYEECRAAARAFDVPIREVFREAESAYRSLARDDDSESRARDNTRGDAPGENPPGAAG